MLADAVVAGDENDDCEKSEPPVAFAAEVCPNTDGCCAPNTFDGVVAGWDEPKMLPVEGGAAEAPKMLADGDACPLCCAPNKFAV